MIAFNKILTLLEDNGLRTVLLQCVDDATAIRVHYINKNIKNKLSQIKLNDTYDPFHLDRDVVTTALIAADVKIDIPTFLNEQKITTSYSSPIPTSSSHKKDRELAVMTFLFKRGILQPTFKKFHCGDFIKGVLSSLEFHLDRTLLFQTLISQTKMFNQLTHLDIFIFSAPLLEAFNDIKSLRCIYIERMAKANFKTKWTISEHVTELSCTIVPKFKDTDFSHITSMVIEKFHHSDSVHLPPNLIKLSICDYYSIHGISGLPASLIYLDLGNKYNAHLKNLPPGLVEIRLGRGFNQPLIINIPIRIIIINGCFDHPIDNLPDSTLIIDIWGSFKQPIRHLPPRLLDFKIPGGSFNHFIPIFPDTIETMFIGKAFTKAFDKKLYPKNMTRAFISGKRVLRGIKLHSESKTKIKVKTK